MANKLTRRKFIADASCAAMGSTAFLSSFLNLGMINTLAARPHIITNTSDYKAIVCILLAGGADTFNVLVPTETNEYDEYKTTRGAIALDADATDPAELLPLDYNDAGRTFSVNGNMEKVQELFDTGDLSFIANIGTLAEPIANKAEYQSGLKKRPLGLFSHSDQIMQWQTSVPLDRSAVGFGGRMADILHDMNSIQEVSMNISLSGKNRFQTGNLFPEYSLKNNTTAENIGFSGVSSNASNSGYLNDVLSGSISNSVEQEYANIFQKTMGELTKQTSESIELFQAALGNVVPLSTIFSDTNLSNDLKKIAEIIQVKSHLGAQRQVFFVTIGGWDHHDDVKARQGALLPQVSNALFEFNAAMEELNQKDNVVTYTVSDFARTLTTNGNGSDHAWGGNQMIMGGPIKGKEIFGEYPSLHLDNPLNVSHRGNLIPTTSVDEFYAEIALWFGVSINDLEYVLPNLCNFYSSSNCTVAPPSDYMPIGMFQ